VALKILALDGLNNAKLCSMLEPILCTVNGVNSAKIDYLSQRLTMDISGRDTEEIVEDVMGLLRQTFPGVTVKLTDAAVLRQPKLDTTAYRRAETESDLLPDDDYYLDDDDYDMDDEDSSEPEEKKIPWTQRLRQEAASLQMEKVLMLIFWSCIALSLLFLFLSGTWRKSGVIKPHLAAVSYFFVLFSGLFVGENPRSENWFIRALAVGVTLGAFLTGFEMMAILGFMAYILGVMYIDILYNNFEQKNEKNLRFCPETVKCIRNDQTLEIAPEEVREGDRVVFEAGVRLPFPGVLETGPATILPFGESEPRTAEEGDELHKGDQSLEGPITVLITLPNPGVWIPTTRDLILNASVENTGLTSHAKIWVLVLTGLGLIAAAVYYFAIYGLRWDNQGISRVVALVAALLPCSLSVACQTAQKGCLTYLNNQGILLGSIYLMEQIPRLKKVIMNHIGFITEGNIQVETFVPADGFTAEDVILSAAEVESLVEGDNLIAAAILKYAVEHLELEQVPSGESVEAFEVLEGYGIRGMNHDVLVMVGSERMMAEIELEVPVLEDGRMAIYVAIRGEYAGAFVLSDSIREGSVKLIRELHQNGVEEVGLLTGYDGVVVRAATLLTGADSSYVESTYVERRLLLSRLTAMEKGRIAIVGPIQKTCEFFDMCTCIETGCGVRLEEDALPREQEIHIVDPGPNGVSELVQSCQALSRILLIGVLVTAIPKAFLMAAIMLWNVPLPLVFAVNCGIAWLLYLLASSLFSEENRKAKTKKEESPVVVNEEEQQEEDY